MELTSSMLVLSLFVLVLVAEGGDVLFGGMHASRSHIGSMMPLALRLARDNHSVHFFESYTLLDPFPFPPSITSHLFKLPGDLVYSRQVLGLMWTRSYAPDVMSQLHTTGDNAFLDILDTHPQKFYGLMNATWDLHVVDELFGLASMGIALRHFEEKHTPYIIQSTTSTIQCYTWQMGLGRPVYHRPSMWFPNGDDLHFDPSLFWMRLRAAIRGVHAFVTSDFLPQKNAVFGMRAVGIEDFSFFRLWHLKSFNFVEDLATWVFPAAVSNEIKNVGRSCKKVKKLGAEFSEFVEDPNSKGTIFVAFGTNVLWEFAPEYIVDAFFDTLDRLSEYRVIFTYNGPKRNRTIPAHMKIVSWSPQLELLSHPKTKVYVTHGGLKSVKEAICTATPLVVFPLFAEQTYNAATVLKMGFARSLNKYTVDEKKLYDAIVDVLENPKYTVAVEKYSRMFTDLPMEALDEGAFFAKRAMRLKTRTPYFKIEGAKLSWAESLYVVFAVGLLVLWTVLSF
ncbi:hypothetical protein QR680_017831 [Steinernema hermaphroditum]|uniref:UDP-glucuronosyltransferase n=1 Tax=Steinernema hermaphroditum TaxID=289476 RepID=A0AA39HFZ5_9BILA|nr:hypothetical protein QR680_017831 [Steinernema hermaphroditum]